MDTSMSMNISSTPPSLGDYDPFISTSASMSINLILGLPLNCYVIWLILGASRETMASDIFCLNMATSELLFASSGILYLINVKLKSLLVLHFFTLSLGLIYTARPLFQSCICVEYYLGVIHPVVFLRFKPLRYRVVCSCVLWLIVLLSCLYMLNTFTTPMYLFLYFIQTLLMFGVMLFCCLSVLWALTRPGPGDGDTGKRTSNAMKKRAFKMISLVMVSMAIHFLVYIVEFPMQCFLGLLDYYRLLDICFTIALTFGFLYPLHYLHRSGKLPCMRKI